MEEDLAYSNLTRGIIGSLFEVDNSLGFGYGEKIYQEALAKEFERRGLAFIRENFSRVMYKGSRVGGYFNDFVIEGKVVLELKVGKELYTSHVKQVLHYLKDNHLRVGILAAFSPKGVLIKRIIN